MAQIIFLLLLSVTKFAYGGNGEYLPLMVQEIQNCLIARTRTGLISESHHKAGKYKQLFKKKCIIWGKTTAIESFFCHRKHT